MNLDNLSREQAIQMLKDDMCRCHDTHTFNINRYEGTEIVTFVKGEYYNFDCSEGGTYLFENGHCHDIYDLLETDSEAVDRCFPYGVCASVREGEIAKRRLEQLERKLELAAQEQKLDYTEFNDMEVPF